MTRDILGPDLSKLPSLEQQLAMLDEVKVSGDVRDYVAMWLAVSDQNGGAASAYWWNDDHPELRAQILTGVHCDEQEAERRARYEALHNHRSDVEGWAQAIEAELVRRGRFIDNRRAPLKEVAAVVRAFVATGGRLMLPPIGEVPKGNRTRVEAQYNSARLLTSDWTPAESTAAAAMLRILRRWRAQPALDRIVRRLGARTPNGWIVLGAKQ